MWRIRLLLILTVLTFILFTQSTVHAGGKCNVCHSKDPKMVAMHKKLQYKGCNSCHGGGMIKFPEDRLDRRGLDPLCNRCHKG
jgi:hypothetical protein